MNANYRIKFQKLFGITPENMGEALIVSPFFSEKLFQPKLKNVKKFKGLIFHGMSGMYKGKKITFVNTGIGQSFVVDCVLSVDEKQIKSIIFLGAAGGVRNLKIAETLLITQAFYDTDYFEKFGFNFNQEPIKSFSPENKLVDSCFEIAKDKGYNLKKASVISLHTLWDQNEELIQKIHNRNINCVDLECALFYASTSFKKIKSLAFCYVSDLVSVKPYWSDFSPQERLLMKQSIANLVNLALELAYAGLN